MTTNNQAAQTEEATDSLESDNYEQAMSRFMLAILGQWVDDMHETNPEKHSSMIDLLFSNEKDENLTTEQCLERSHTLMDGIKTFIMARYQVDSTLKIADSGKDYDIDIADEDIVKIRLSFTDEEKGSM